MKEILFDICQRSELKLKYHRFPKDTIDSTDSILVFIPTDHVWQQAMEAWEAWQRAGLADYSPNLAPVIWRTEELQRQASPSVYNNLTNLVDGKQNLRDLAVKLKQNLLPLTEAIMPYIQQKLLGFVEVEDLSSIAQPEAPAPSPTLPTKLIGQQATRQLVAYIDDSQSDSLKMNHILTQAHYRFISIQDPVKALPLLLEHKPDLIFLDLVMPIANGYEICAQIRRVSAFKETPIIILTSNDGLVDRVRAKMVSSSGFLSKPITSEKVQRVLQKYLSPSIPLRGTLNREQTKMIINPVDNFEF